MESWASTLVREVEVLEPYGWFEPVHDQYGGDINVDGVWIPRFKAGTFVCSPAPVFTIIVIE